MTLRTDLDRLRSEGRLTDPGPSAPPPGCSEAEFTKLVIALAQSLGWRVLHLRPARTAKGWRTPVQGDGKGFPDLLLVRSTPFPRRVIAAELKSARGRLTPGQQSWITALEAAGMPVYLWRPGDWSDIREVLGGNA